jgi:hypothetical protein
MGLFDNMGSDDLAMLSQMGISPEDPDLQDAAPEEGDLGPWLERLPKELQDTLCKMADGISDEFKYPRRLEIMKAWKARNFWRELQHLTWSWDSEAWDVLGPAAGTGRAGNDNLDSAVLYTTNIYQGFGESFLAVITQATPNVRFEPEDPMEPADIETAEECEPMRKFIQHENDPIKLMTRAAYLAWTDGRIHGQTFWGKEKRTGQYREMQVVEGVLEVKVPIIYGDMEDYPYLQYSKEYHLAAVRSMVREREFDQDYWKQIKGGVGARGQDLYERTARLSVLQGVGFKAVGSDQGFANLSTVQRTWIRPEMFLAENVPEDQVDDLLNLFPNGCALERANGLYIGSKNASMDDEWKVENIMEGDGANRPAKGTCLISVNERANDIINIAQDVYEKTQPASWWDSELFDLDAMNEQASIPGQRYSVDMSDMEPGDSLEAHVLFEKAAEVSPDMLTYLQSLMNTIPEFLTGLSAILFGGGGDNTDQSGKALSIQQAAAMGRVGLPFRVMKRFYAGMMEQAVRCGAANRTEDVHMGVPDSMGKTEPLSVRISAMTGKARCYPDVDENYPESWMAKRATYMRLMAEANMDPVLHAILTSPRNQVLAKKYIGLTDMEIPDADSWNKQMMEIAQLLVEPMTETLQPQPGPLTGQVTMVPTPASSIPIDQDYDNHEAEFLTVTLWINDMSKGQKAKATNPDGFQNVRQHGLEHRAVLLQKMVNQAKQAALETSAAGKKNAPAPKGEPSEPRKTQEQNGQGMGGPSNSPPV